MLEADITELIQLTVTLDDVGSQIGHIKTRKSADHIDTALPGCAIGAACSQAGEFAEGAWFRVSDRITTLSGLVKQATSDLSVTDEEFAKRLDAIRFQIEGGN